MVYRPHMFFYISNSAFNRFNCIKEIEGYKSIIKNINIIITYGIYQITIIFNRTIEKEEFDDIIQIVMDYYKDKRIIFSYKKYTTDYEYKFTNRTEHTKSIKSRIVNIIPESIEQNTELQS